MESAVVFCNHLQRMMVDQCGAKPSPATLTKAFAAYQNERKPRVKHIMEYSSLITNVQAWRTPIYRFVATWVLPLQSDRAVADQLGEIIRRAPKLDFVDIGDFVPGRLSWKHEDRRTAVQIQHWTKRGDSLNHWSTIPVRVMSAALAISFFVFAARYIRMMLLI